jgi:hypothetical protein
MSKYKKSIGQPILGQIFKLIPKNVTKELTAKYKSDKHYKSVKFNTHLISSLYGVLTFCNGLRELCEGLLGCEGKLNHIGLITAPARSSLSDANTKRSYLIFEALYYELLKQYHSFISDSRLKGLSIKNLKIIDSTTIRLFSDILQGVGRNPTDGSRKKGGLKVHTLMNAFSGVAEFVRITAAKQHDRKFLLHLKLQPQSFIVFDKAYNLYHQFSKWTDQQVWFVTRMKDNAVYHVTKVIKDHSKKKNRIGVIKEQYITIGFKQDNQNCRLTLRRITYKTDDNKVYVFLTNNFKLSAQEIANIYKCRWMIELLFKQIKQNFPLNYFWGNSSNAIKIQIYTVLIVQLLMVVIRKKTETKKSFANMITVIRLHLMSYIDLFEFIKDTHRAWRKANAPPNLFSKI